MKEKGPEHNQEIAQKHFERKYSVIESILPSNSLLSRDNLEKTSSRFLPLLKHTFLPIIVFETSFGEEVRPGIHEQTYLSYLADYFQKIYHRDIIDASGSLQEGISIESFFVDSEETFNHDFFIKDLIGNFRIIYLLMEKFRPGKNNIAAIKSECAKSLLGFYCSEGQSPPPELLKQVNHHERQKYQALIEFVEAIRGRRQEVVQKLVAVIGAEKVGSNVKGFYNHQLFQIAGNRKSFDDLIADILGISISPAPICA